MQITVPSEWIRFIVSGAWFSPCRTTNMSDDSGWGEEERRLFMLIKQSLMSRTSNGTEKPGEAHGLRSFTQTCVPKLAARTLQSVSDTRLHDLPLDWDRFIGYAVEGGVAPMVYAGLQEDEGDIPAEVISRLHGFYVLAAAENMAYLRYAREIFSLCKDENIDVIALRGINFASTLYPDPALRPLSDIDLLVRPQQMDQLVAVLTLLGYWNIPGHLHQWTNAKVVVDVHTDLVGGDRISARRRAVDINMDAVWASSTLSGAVDGEIRKLAWEDEVLTCSLHAIKHSCDRILWFADIALMIGDRTPEDWHRLMDRARQFKLEKPAYYAFTYLQRTIGVSTPDHVLETLHPSQAGWLEGRCMTRVMAGKQMGRFGELFTLFMMDHITDKWAFIIETCFPQRDVLEQAYGPMASGRTFTRLKRIWHIADMAYNVIKQGSQRWRS
jgi:hypothetical protein